MKYLFLALMLTSVLYSCKPKGWPESEKKFFIDECVRQNAGRDDVEIDVERYCTCFSDKMEANYTVEELDKVSLKEMREYGVDCIEEQKGRLPDDHPVHKHGEDGHTH
jgi:hypothetical protein